MIKITFLCFKFLFCLIFLFYSLSFFFFTAIRKKFINIIILNIITINKYVKLNVWPVRFELSYTIPTSQRPCARLISATYMNLACTPLIKSHCTMHTYIQAHRGRNVVHDDEWSTGENFRQRHDGKRAINLDVRKGEA